MTLLAERPPAAPAPPPPPPPASSPQQAPPLETSTIVWGGVFSFVAAVVLVLGFVIYLIAFSRLSEARAQHSLRQTLQRELAAATGPVNPRREGTPISALSIPAIGLNDAIVVQGTSSRDLQAGPGHLPNTAIPGQPGISTIFGKFETFGAPFHRLLSLQQGNIITVTTGQGTSRYKVSSFGDLKHPPPANGSTNRLLLITSLSVWNPKNVAIVSANLVTSPHSSSGKIGQVSVADNYLKRDWADTVVPLAGWSQLLLLAVIATTVAFGWRAYRWPVVLCATPIILTLMWLVYENTAGLMINLV